MGFESRGPSYSASFLKSVSRLSLLKPEVGRFL